ncbi:unnamed protein product [Lactuca virosa]|uniref:Uncharacterized protein n=1 Tax=Lactuca virosa TaxID=75947 RepID=A0AAU9N087_9ASTR|nr:unnamed protein product [Lactuca virosa]
MSSLVKRCSYSTIIALVTDLLQPFLSTTDREGGTVIVTTELPTVTSLHMLLLCHRRLNRSTLPMNSPSRPPLADDDARRETLDHSSIYNSTTFNTGDPVGRVRCQLSRSTTSPVDGRFSFTTTTPGDQSNRVTGPTSIFYS